MKKGESSSYKTKGHVTLKRTCPFLFVFFALGWIMFFSSCESDMEKIKLITSDTTLPSEQATIVEIQYSDSGVIKAKIFSPLIEIYRTEDPYMEMSKGVTAFFYGDDNKVESSLKANYAINYENRKLLELRNDVVVKNEKGETLNSEKLMWDQTTEKIYTDKQVKITTKNEILWGEGFEADQNFSSYKINKPTGSITIKTDE